MLDIAEKKINISINKLLLYIGFFISLIAFMGSILTYISEEAKAQTLFEKNENAKQLIV
ncbi:MAG: hypothetical protein KAI43_08410 [Candidatus Aureabacteria bacterium]|nr:hypothetical protein [Candidatus Auribacterota bacterium]